MPQFFIPRARAALPRGALGTHRNLTTNVFAQPFSAARNAARRGEPIPEPKPRITLVAVPFFHVVGALSNLIPTMAAGGKLVLMKKF